MVSEKVRPKINDRLLSLGIEDQDEMLIAYLYELTLEHVLNNINQEELPDGLTYHFVEAICGKYVQACYLSGRGGIDFDTAFKSVHLGDTTVELGGLSEADKYKALTDALNKGLEAELECYRQLRW